MADGVDRVVVVGASAGGIEATTQLVRGLPADLPAAVLVAVHLSSDAPSALPRILARAGELPALHPADGEAMRAGVIYVAPPDHHLLVDGRRVRVVRGPRENGHRPAIDPLFRSAARHYGPRAVAVVLSGVLDDGSAGMRAVKQAGGVGVVQDFEDALYDAMPRNAMAAAPVDHVVPAAEAGPLVAKLVAEVADSPEGAEDMADNIDVELALTQFAARGSDAGEGVGPSSPYSCPDCHGVLNEITELDSVRYRCRVGHAWSPESLLAAQTVGLETALWMALRALEEKASLSRRLANRAKEYHARLSERRFSEQAEDAQQGAEAIRALLARSGALAHHAAGPADPAEPRDAVG